ncbi:MAG: glycosyltransferase family 4 protein, partial [Nitrosarchaeum sp.]
MNILLITQFLSTTKGGGEYLFSIMANELAKKGHKIWIITHKIENENYENFHNNITIIFASSVKYEGGLPPTIHENVKFICSSFFKGLKLIKQEKIDLIHSNNFSPAFAASLISSFTKCPHITA